MSDATLQLKADAAPLRLVLKLLQGVFERGEFSLDLGNLPAELVRVETDQGAAGTGELIVRLYPSDALLRAVATAVASQIDFV